jgi:multiple sugar transport system substrate-binding protein
MRSIAAVLSVFVLAAVLAAGVFSTPARAATDEEKELAGYKDFMDKQAALAKRVHITYWEKWVDYEGGAARDMVARFNESQDRIYVHYLYSNYADREVMLAVRGGCPPDVAGLWAYNTAGFAASKELQPLDDMMKQSSLDPDRYIPGYLELCQFDGKTWALPSTSASLALFWNKEHFKAKAEDLKKAGLDPTRPPQTIEDLEKYAEVLTEYNPDGSIKRMGFLPTEPGWWNYSWVYWFGGKIIEPKTGKPTLDDSANVEAYAWLKHYVEKFGRERLIRFQGGVSHRFDTPMNPFMAGQVSMEVQGTWFPMFIQRHASRMDYGVAAFPTAKGVAGPRTFLDTDILVIPAGCKHPKEAWEFILWVQKTGAAMLAKGQGKGLSVRTMPDGYYDDHPNKNAAEFQDLAASPQAFVVPQVAKRFDVIDEMNDAFGEIWQWPVEKEKAAELKGLEGAARAARVDQLCRDEVTRILKAAQERVIRKIEAYTAIDKAVAEKTK